MFTGPYGVFENGTFCEYVAVQKEHLCLVPDNVSDVAATLPVAYAQHILRPFLLFYKSLTNHIQRDYCLGNSFEFFRMLGDGLPELLRRRCVFD